MVGLDLRFCANASYTASDTNLFAHRAKWYWLAALICIRLSKMIPEHANGYVSFDRLNNLSAK